MWIQIDEEYLKYLKNHEDARVPNQDYGKHRFKPFFKLFKLKGTDITYVSQVSHPQKRHESIKPNIDFYKIYDDRNELSGVVNLNMMFPVLDKYIIEYDMKMIEERVAFKEGYDFTYYENRLNLYEDIINNVSPIKKNAIEVYTNKYTRNDPRLSSRSLDFKQLEARGIEYELSEILERDDISVRASRRGFKVKIEEEQFNLTYSQVGYLNRFAEQMMNDLMIDNEFEME